MNTAKEKLYQILRKKRNEGEQFTGAMEEKFWSLHHEKWNERSGKLKIGMSIKPNKHTTR